MEKVDTEKSKDDELIFYWSDCSKLDADTTFLNIEGESRRKSNEYCMKIRENDRLLKYKDCKGDAPFVCEVPYVGKLIKYILNA